MEINSLLIIFLALSLAYLLSRIARKLSLPRSIGQIIAGIILSLVILKFPIFNSESLNLLTIFANFGIVLLFYYIGLNINFNAVEKTIKKSLVVSIFKTIVPISLGFVVMYYIFNLPVLPSLIIGLILSTSAQSVSIDLLDELKMLRSRLGTKIIGVGVITDLFELFLVTALLAFFAISETSITQILLGLGLFIVFLIFARLWLIPQTLKYMESDKNSTDRFTGSLLILLLLVVISEFLQVGALVGAVVAGIMVKQTIFKDDEIPNWEEYDISRSIHIVAFGFLIPIFFVWVGLNTNILELVNNYVYVIVFSLITIVGIIGSVFLAGIFTKDSFKENLALGWGLTPKGDIGFVLLVIALDFAIISNEIFTSIVLMSLLVTIISPIFFKRIIQKNRRTLVKKK